VNGLESVWEYVIAFITVGGLDWEFLDLILRGVDDPTGLPMRFFFVLMISVTVFHRVSVAFTSQIRVR